jgi:dTDP-4-dehydrorhamnose 3,5-epimerase
MKLESIKSLIIPEIKVVCFSRFIDNRGYFTETYSIRDFKTIASDIGQWHVAQVNESFSKMGTIRGLHFQWNPYMGKLVRTVNGHMIDLVLDIRIGSPNFGKIIAYNMQASPDKNYNEWIWVPPGFAHGNFFLKDTIIEYLCTNEYSQGFESGISPLAVDINWSLCDSDLKMHFDIMKISMDLKMTEKDKNAFSIKKWVENKYSKNFIYKDLIK